jgi:hypothetical protein
MAVKKGSQIGPTNSLLEIKQRTESPKIRFPFLAGVRVKDKPEMPPQFGGKRRNDIYFPTAVQKPTIKPFRRTLFEMQQKMSKLME